MCGCNIRRFRVPRVMVDVAATSTATTMLGFTTAAPIYISAAAKGGYAHPEGEVALCRAAAAAGVIQMVPHFASKPLKEIAAARRSARPASGEAEQVQFIQIYVEKQRERSAAFVAELAAQGFKALFLTVDSAGVSKNETDLRFTPGGNANTANGGDAKARRWADNLTWADVPFFRKHAGSMKLVLKGVQAGEDAVLAYEHGLDGIVCSNHGGRRVDTARPAVKVLVEVMAALRALPRFDPARFEVFVDGGVQRGTDVFKCLALGASGVGIGRAALMGLAAYGERGATAVLEILKEELTTCMQFMGTPTLAHVARARLSGVDQAMQATCWPAGREHLPALRFPDSQVYEQ
eukprot:SAG11_NODE_6582_length_1284_cov_1.422785_1_plen_350_part_00